MLAIHAIVIAIVTTTNAQGQTQITDSVTLRWAFWLLIGLSIALFIVGRRPVRQKSMGAVSGWQRWEGQDWLRILIPPVAFVGWTMLQRTSVWNAVAPHMSGGMRILIPMVGAVVLAAVTKALATHADKKQLPRGRADQQETAKGADVAEKKKDAHLHSPAPDGVRTEGKQPGKET